MEAPPAAQSDAARRDRQRFESRATPQEGELNGEPDTVQAAGLRRRLPLRSAEAEERRASRSRSPGVPVLGTGQRGKWLTRARRLDSGFAFALVQGDEDRRRQLLLSWAADKDASLLEKARESAAVCRLLEENRERLLNELVGAFVTMREKETQRLYDVHEAAASINSEFQALLT